MKYFIDSIEVPLEELERIRKEECVRKDTYSEELKLIKIDLDKHEMYLTFIIED